MIRFAVKLERVEIRKMDEVKPMGTKLVIVPDNTEWEELCVKTPFNIEITENIEDKATVHEVTMKVTLIQDTDFSHRYAYRVTLYGGRRLLIGSNRRPYPVATSSYSAPATPTENQLQILTVSYRSPRPIPYIL